MTTSAIAAACPPCGRPASDGDAFCAGCGRARVVTASRAPASAFVALAPLVRWLRERRWWRSHEALVVAFGVAPFVVLQASDSLPARDSAAGFAAYFGLMWAVVIYRLVRPERQSWWLIARVVVATAAFGTALALALETWFTADDPGLLGYVLTVGVPEELVKALPVLLFVWTSRTRWSPRTYLFVGAMSGLAFGVVEAAGYFTFYEDLAYSTGQSYTSESIWRLVSGGLIHACLAAITGYFIGVAYWRRRAALLLLGLGLALSSGLHGTYDALADGWTGVGLAALIIVVFTCYVRSADDVAPRLSPTPVPGRA